MTREHLNLQTADKRVVTPEMLRAYWFGWPQVPFWNYDPSKLQVGVKIEYFIAKRGASPLSLAG